MSNTKTKKDKLPRKDLKVVGELYIGYMMTIYRDLDGNFYTFAKAETGVSEDIADKLIEFTWKERTLYLMDPWERVEYYEDEFGHHYLCNVYDCVYIDVFAESVEELLNLLQVMLRPDEKGWDELLDSINKDNEATIKPKDSESNSDSKQSEKEVET